MEMLSYWQKNFVTGWIGPANGLMLLTHWGQDKMAAFPNNIFNCIFLNENVWISNKISLNFFPKGPINNISALV